MLYGRDYNVFLTSNFLGETTGREKECKEAANHCVCCLGLASFWSSPHNTNNIVSLSWYSCWLARGSIKRPAGTRHGGQLVKCTTRSLPPHLTSPSVPSQLDILLVWSVRVKKQLNFMKETIWVDAVSLICSVRLGFSAVTVLSSRTSRMKWMSCRRKEGEGSA